MKLLLLHGPAISVSRTKLVSFKKDFDSSDIVTYEEGSNMGEVGGSLATLPLLSNERLIILENPPEDFANYQLPTANCQLILWFDHELTEKKPIMEWVKKNGQVLFFPEGKEISICPFLYYLGNKDKKALLELDKLKKAGYDHQYFITMIFYLLRNLIATPKAAKEFVKKKNEKMRANFKAGELINLYQSVLEIDFKIKSGLLETNQAEFLLINKFIEHKML